MRRTNVTTNDGLTTGSDLREVARRLRVSLIENSHRSKTPHLGSCLSCVEILVSVYFCILRIDPGNPRDPGRDRFILSKGHAAPALSHVLALRGFFPESRLENYGQDGGIFAGHPPTPDQLPGVEAATGSLGHGLPIGLGMRLAASIQGQRYNVYVLLSDGECNEGTIWEAAMLAAAQKVERLCVVVDFNQWQATGRSREVMALDPLADKWRAFGWDACEVDGHDIHALTDALRGVPSGTGKPVAVIAHTVKGKGVSFMEDNNDWHYRIPSAEEVLRAKKELGKMA